MTINIDEIEIDCCYATGSGQVRHVMDMNDEKVKYQARGKEPRKKPWGSATWVSKAKFAQDVAEKVSCDFIPL